MAGKGTACAPEDLRSLYDTYINSVTEQWMSQDLGGIIGHMFTGGGRFGRDTWVAPFLEALETLTAACAAEPMDPAMARAMVEYMLFGVYDAAPDTASDGLAAAEGRALPLIGLLDPADIPPLYERYRARLRKSRGLPCQREVLKALKNACQ